MLADRPAPPPAEVAPAAAAEPGAAAAAPEGFELFGAVDDPSDPSGDLGDARTLGAAEVALGAAADADGDGIAEIGMALIEEANAAYVDQAHLHRGAAGTKSKQSLRTPPTGANPRALATVAGKLFGRER